MAQLLSARPGYAGRSSHPARRPAGSGARPGQTGALGAGTFGHLFAVVGPAGQATPQTFKVLCRGRSELGGERGPLRDRAWGRVVLGWPRAFRDPRVGGDPHMPSEPSELSLKGCVQMEKIRRV